MAIVSRKILLVESFQRNLWRHMDVGSLSVEFGDLCFWDQNKEVIWPRILDLNLRWRWHKWQFNLPPCLFNAVMLALFLAHGNLTRVVAFFLILQGIATAFLIVSIVIPSSWIEVQAIDDNGKTQTVYFRAGGLGDCTGYFATKRLFRDLQVVRTPVETAIQAASGE
jgi:hypothetical protein